MRAKILSSMSAVVTLTVMSSGAFAQKAATPTTVKIGYFNLALVKGATPGGGADMLRDTAESQLRSYVEDANRQMTDAKKAGKSDADLKTMAEKFQTEINAKQQALVQLVQQQTAIQNQAIATAVNSVAKDKSLDIVIDGAGVFAGGQKILDNGQDITQDVVRKVNPVAASASGK